MSAGRRGIPVLHTRPARAPNRIDGYGATKPMKRAHLTIAAIARAVLTSHVAARKQTPVEGRPAVDVSARLKTAVPDLARRLARFKPVRMPFSASGLTARERQMVDQLVVACRYLERMYWRQSDPEGLALYKALERTDTPLARSVRQYLLVNGSRWDLVDENRPFIDGVPMPAGRALYPP